MKRKFSLNLAPKVASRSHDKPTPEPTPSHAQSQSHSHSDTSSHKRHTSKDTICDNSAWINRRLLDPRTELELRVACQHILENFKPSDHGMEDTDPKLDFGGFQNARPHRTKDRNDTRSEPKVRMPTGAPVDLKTALEARGLKQTELTLKSPTKDAPARANSSKKRTESDSSRTKPDFGWLDDRDERMEEKLRRSLSQRRKPHQADNPAAEADAEATEWMRNERARYDASEPQRQPSTSVRPPSRARSIRDNIRDYVFPGNNSRVISRKQSADSLRTASSQDPNSDPPHSAGRRGWSLRRGSSSRSSSRPGTSKGQSDKQEQTKADKNVVNLNRELPPLPGLDSWKDEVQQVAKPPIAPTHIASLMRPQEPSAADRTAAKRKSHRSSGSDSLAMQYNARHASRSPLNAMRHNDAASRSKTLTPDSLHALEGMTITNSASTSNLGHRSQRSGETSSPTKSSEVINFSRKMSVDVSTRSAYVTDVKVAKKEEQESRLKKVFSGWMKKEKKDDWMQKIEKQGIKEGIMIQEGAAGAPVVRY